MRNIIFILLILFMPIGCETSNKPNNLIGKKQMENIIFDIFEIPIIVLKEKNKLIK